MTELDKVWYEWQAIYARAGLTPWDDFTTQIMARNRRGGHPLMRGIGATTWMAARALVDLTRGHNVLILGQTRQRAEVARDAVRDLLRRIWPGKAITHNPGNLYLDGWTNTLRWASGSLPPGSVWSHPGATTVGSSGYVYYLDEWEKRMERRALGPFAMIRRCAMRRLPCTKLDGTFSRNHNIRKHARRASVVGS